jgi:hypothetical protein
MLVRETIDSTWPSTSIKVVKDKACCCQDVNSRFRLQSTRNDRFEKLSFFLPFDVDRLGFYVKLMARDSKTLVVRSGSIRQIALV